MKNVLKIKEKFVKTFNENKLISESFEEALYQYTQNKIACSSFNKNEDGNISNISNLYINYLKTTKQYIELLKIIGIENVALITLVQNSKKNNFYI